MKDFVKFVQSEKAKMDAVLGCIGDGITIQDKNFKIIYQNDLIKNMMGVHLGDFCYRAYQKNDSICDNCQVEKAFKDGKTHRIERTVSSDDCVSYVAITASPLKNDFGEIIGGIEIVRDITERKKIEQEREELINKLEKSVQEIKTLRRILPICSFCKNIRNDEGYYEQIEAYIHKHSGVDFSHTICPECAKTHYPEFTK